MDAVRLIRTTRHALAEAGEAREVLVEAWQAQALAEAVGGRLATDGPPELRAEARGLSEAGGRACGALHHSVLPAGGVRARRMSGVRDPRSALLGLGGLLGEVAMALVGVACVADQESRYWQCIEAIDAADESGDRVRALVKHLAELARWSVAPPPGAVGEVPSGPVSGAVAGVLRDLPAEPA